MASSKQSRLLRVGPTDAMRSIDRLRRAALNARGFASRRVPTSQGSIHVLEGRSDGPLPALVLLHGLSASSTDYAPLLPQLRGIAKRILIPDLPGHGASATPVADHDDVLWDTVREALDQVLDQPALIFGNSLGGFTAIRYAVRSPELVQGLMLASPGGAPMNANEIAHLRSHFDIESYGDARAFIRRVFPTPHWSHRLVAWGAGVRMRRPVTQRVLDKLHAPQMLTPAELGELSMPTLLLWGEQERLLPESGLRFFENHLPDHARIERPAAFGHAPFIDRPAEVARYIREFAAKLGR